MLAHEQAASDFTSMDYKSTPFTNNPSPGLSYIYKYPSSHDHAAVVEGRPGLCCESLCRR